MEPTRIPTDLDAKIHNLHQSDVLRELRCIAAADIEDHSVCETAVQLASAVARTLARLYDNPYGLPVREDVTLAAHEQLARLRDAAVHEKFVHDWADFLQTRIVRSRAS